MTTPDAARFDHVPVMAAEIVAALAEVPAGVVLDATVGGGGHAAAVLERRADLRLVGLDRDAVALAAAAQRLEPFGDRVVLRRARFDQLVPVLDRERIAGLSAAVFDLGVSSPQLDVGERGFSFRHDGPLDMRMDDTDPLTAAAVVNDYTEAELSRVLREYADERFARRIAAAIVAARPLRSTGELAEVVRAAIPAPARRRGGHPATRTFQAIRIEVNRELDVLPVALRAAIDLLVPGGRIAVLAYHSGEDRIVKSELRAAATGGCTCPTGLPCVCGASPSVDLVRQVPKRPSTAELDGNPRAGSARLRVAERRAPDLVADGGG